ncbi:hypothetical protein V1525DRAFT_126044 [Lipomyces kononenkoae]|uniref:Uncharacterized protein n=1 Tax=Lipomyces kononenkoae TaxID=34357 RepID=A0ACC3SQC2_LIPKO
MTTRHFADNRAFGRAFLREVRRIQFAAWQGDADNAIDQAIHVMRLVYPAPVMDYLVNEYLNPVARRIWLHCFTRNNVNFGLSTSSMVESANRSVKRFVERRTSPIGTVLAALGLSRPYVEKRQKIRRATKRTRQPVTVTDCIELDQLRHQISDTALRLLASEFEMILTGDDLLGYEMLDGTCTCSTGQLEATVSAHYGCSRTAYPSGD